MSGHGEHTTSAAGLGGRGGYRGFGGRNRWRSRWTYNKRGNNSGDRGGGSRKRDGSSDDNRNEPNGNAGFRGNRGRNGGRGYYNRNDGNAGQIENNDYMPPPPKKKRVDPLQTIKTNVINHWRKMLPGYDLYYCDKVPQLSEFEKKVAAVEAFLNNIRFAEDNLDPEAERDENHAIESFYSMRFEEILKNELLMCTWQDFESDLCNEPDETIALWSVTAHKVMYNVLAAIRAGNEEQESVVVPPLVQIGFSNFYPITPLIGIKAELLGKFVAIKGAIVRTGNIHPYCRRLTFRCRICDAEYAVEQPDGKYTPPVICKAEDCKNNNAYLFEAKEKAPTTVIVDSRRMRLQDILHCDIDRGSVPRTIDCILFGDLAEQCNTGDAVTLNGIIKMVKDTHYGEQSLHHMFIEVSSITQHKESERTMGGQLLNFTNMDYAAVKEIHDTPNIFKLLIASLCPAIYGHELVKAGLLLCLFGGTSRDDGLVSIRSDINMLMVGDPGIGKSQMLNVLTECAPRAVYVCGTGSTVAGLTVTLVKDRDDYSLEAGALVMADRGICCIDEFDKMAAQHHALLEALEQQSVSVAKSGVYRTLPARTAVIAAANPVGGHYDACKTVVENIKINPALMSRFDLIFILLDRPDQEFDEKLIAHMAEVRKVVTNCGTGTPASVRARSQPDRGSNRCRELALDDVEEHSEHNLLINKVRIQPGEVLDLLPHVLLRKYIAYAKHYVYPKVSPEAAEVLKKYYLNMRLSHRDVNSTPVTARQLESLVRLTEARAKLELREVATVEDANEILEIFDFSLSSAFDSEVHAISALSKSVLLNSSVSSGRCKSVASQAKKLMKALQDLAEKQSKSIFSVDEIKQVATAIGFREKSDSLIAALNNEGILLKKGGKTYQLQTADY